MEPDLPTKPTHSHLPVTLLTLLSNTLILYQTAPYLPVSSLLSLSATSRPFKSLIQETRGVFRHLDLGQIKSAQFQIAAIDHGGEVWRNAQLDENVTEDDGPLLGVFSNLRRHQILQDVQTLLLDGLSVTADLITEIICRDSFNVRILSIREVQNLNERKLQQALLYAIRPSRPSGTLKLEALYFFGPKDALPVSRFRKHVNSYPQGIAPIDTVPSYGGVIHSQGAQIGARWNEKSGDTLADEIERSGDKWYQKSGKVILKQPSLEWAETLQACQGIISFDAVLCRGPRHSESVAIGKDLPSGHWYQHQDARLSPRIATHAIEGCCVCGTSPEGFSYFGTSPMEQFPLLAPPPLLTSTAKSAKAPTRADTLSKKLLVRCLDCLRNRFCESCHKWWCEDCYEVPTLIPHLSTPVQSSEFIASTLGAQPDNKVKVHMGLCVESCLVAEMMSGAGSNGMWG
ncbi:hypothetical protein LHYA1_G002384 [Lachnellula hyalina]|uniref:F-box domain-containing protein n=1 Tax=Lachnellula hyalina TaxID=1316788 RepID=A0A8H8U1W7_9HELO|nr:uncharacterized protein LHYA1_G002384 [Lachnellula hyalina]TVY28735.1 hypothetical protein LHYA1_G002384 [Lachnellula hyalina]